MLTEASTYDELYHNFRWDVPERFNIATACCDRHADGTGRLALVYVHDDGTTTRASFDEVADMSRRFANVLVADGHFDWVKTPATAVPLSITASSTSVRPL